ncbi:pyruvate dehydrogenase [acetyl-transferring]-phosphatase 1-like protein, mitochondrial [Brevipalpus obovatus]|uniref:pyruvate dehydrogenase [acetyl-transferring]-phosphatase 1-like protein, mitochondrial n=1 Tax=Brevipalpus obovatus TaxID=246614 RepID=UPI003D9F0571
MKAKPFLHVIFAKNYFSRSISHISPFHSHLSHNNHSLQIIRLINPKNILKKLVPVKYFAEPTLTRCFSSKEESYFAAIGVSTDEVPREFTSQQVTDILSANEKTINSSGRINTIECNQLPSNDPIEDRLRVSRIVLDEDGNDVDPVMLFAVFDGHGGRFCADTVTRRLFKYIALSLAKDPMALVTQERIDGIVEDLYLCPNIRESVALTYPSVSDELNKFLAKQDIEALKRYATHLQQNPLQTMEEKLTSSFLHCDQDLSNEIQSGIASAANKVLLHYYLSLAVSGCCVALIIVQGDNCFIASTGDCRAVLGFREASDSRIPVTKSIDLNSEHNSDNPAEIKRLLAAHPKEDRKDIVRNDRLLSHLMPFRAFGDFCYKWEVDKIRRAGLTRAFGSQIIPPNYRTPPYLIADPDIKRISLSCRTPNTVGSRFIVMATDGLWEQFQSSRCVIKQIFRHEAEFDEEKPDLSLSKVNKSAALEDDEIYEDMFMPSSPNDKKAENAENLSETDLVIDPNRSTYLLRAALGTNPSPENNMDDPMDRFRNQHRRLVTFLTLPQHLVRNFRDDISVIVLKLD